MKSFYVGAMIAMALAVVTAARASSYEDVAGIASVQRAPGDPINGKQVYTAQKCNVCHKVNGVGGPIGPELGAIGLKRDAAWLTKYLQNPVALDPKNPPKMKMQPTTAKGKDLDDLIAYLLTLKGK